MALNSRTFIRVPPDSTGKRTGTYFTLQLSYTNRVSTISVGNVIVGSTSNTQGIVLSIIEEPASTSGYLILRLEDQYVNDSYTDGETLTVEGVTVATADGTGDTVHYGETVTVGGNDPTHRQFVDAEGAARTTFVGGSPNFSSFGSLNVSNPKNIVSYDHVGNSDTKLYLITGGNGSGSFDLNASHELLSVDDQSGSFATYRSNIWHRYDPGEPISALLTTVCGDAGKTGLVRRWGYFDDNDGIFFEQSGSTLYVVQRSSVTGTPVDTKVAQSDWNGDRLDGSEGANNVSQVLLDPTKANVYYMDAQWLGAGRTRFGIFSNDRLIICHKFENANANSDVYMKRADLPITYEIVNEANTAGTSEMKAICASVQSSATYDPVSVKRSGKFTQLGYTASYSDPGVLFNIRTGQTSSNGTENRSYGVPKEISIISYDHDIEFTGYTSSSISGASWSTGSGQLSSVEFDFVGNFIDGNQKVTRFVKAGESVTIDLDDIFDDPRDWLVRKADITADPDPITLAAKLLPTATLNTGSQSTGSVGITFIYESFGD